jgi:type VI secretion system secreted protein Hcp
MKSGNLSRLAGLVVLLACGVILIRPAPAWAGTNAFLRLSGVRGEASDQDHKEWIIIESFSWGAINPGATSSFSASGAAQFRDITITKRVDSASPSLFASVTQGRHFPDATFDIFKTGGTGGGIGKPVYVSIALKDVTIASRTVSPDGRTETYHLKYQSAQAITH